VDDRRSRLALTLVNRSESAEPCEIHLRRGVFAGSAKLRCVSASEQGSQVDGVESASLEDGEEKPRGADLSLELPARSFLLIEADIAPD
jgi:hypothetical protein